MYWRDKSVREDPKAKVKYWIRATLVGSEKMKYKQVLIVREPPVAFVQGEQQQETSKVTTWCCVDQGVSAMWSEFEKNVFTPHETARAMINVDNSKC